MTAISQKRGLYEDKGGFCCFRAAARFGENSVLLSVLRRQGAAAVREVYRVFKEN
jgi:hypothetical protein